MDGITCPNCESTMGYDEETGTYTCPDCGYSEER